jgi:prevent-host-death family protein
VKVASQQQVAANFADYVKASQKGPVVVTDNGEPVAVLLKATGKDDLERLLMGHSEKLQAILQAARQRFREGGAQNVETVSTSGTQRHADVLPPSRLWRASATGERLALTAVVRVTGNHPLPDENAAPRPLPHRRPRSAGQILRSFLCHPPFFDVWFRWHAKGACL